eukprot:2274297-Rhodomonas_salina.1
MADGFDAESRRPVVVDDAEEQCGVVSASRGHAQQTQTRKQQTQTRRQQTQTQRQQTQTLKEVVSRIRQR